MLFQLNYQFLSTKPSISIFNNSKSNAAYKQLEAPKLDGPVDHVIYVIHGIGQQTEQFGFFQKHLNTLFDTTMDVMNKNHPEKQLNIQFVPIEWHKHIHDETDEIMNDITLKSIPFLRMINNDYLSDAFFYLSKERGQSIINHVTRSFNQAHLKFKQENPLFKGKIAIMAYSLGGIITWDILSNQIFNTTSKKRHQKRIRKHSKLDLDFPILNFKPDFLFNLGSPLSAFLTVRNQNPKFYRPDSSIIFENIFHPYDPLAYRFEPMLNLKYKQIPAVLVDDYLFKGDHLYMIKHEDSTSGNLLSCLKQYITSNKRKSVTEISSHRKKRKQDSIVNTTITKNAMVPIHYEEKKRIDFVLQPERSLFGWFDKNQYISGLTAHFSYWNHKDLLWHIVRRLENQTS